MPRSILRPVTDRDVHRSRREMLCDAACGFGNLALAGLLANVDPICSTVSAQVHNPLEAKTSHFAARAKSIIFLFMHGGVSHIDTFDPKPKLAEFDGKPLPFSNPLQFSNKIGNLKRSPWKFHKYGQSGIEVSELFPHVGQVVDDICFIRSMHVDQVDHGGAILQLHTGSAVFPRPSMGAWINYGLGTQNQNLPGFVTISPATIHGAQQNYGSAFLPGSYQGTPIGDANSPIAASTIRNLQPGEPSSSLQQLQLEYLRENHKEQASVSAADPRLEARIQSFELAFRMQMEAPEILNINDEPQSINKLYGINETPTDNFGRQCLLARRLVERGVRFVQCSHSYKWDQHGGLYDGHKNNALEVDLPIAGLLIDLKQRGLLNDTLVVWGTEFGRTPMCEGTDGRDHNPYGFTIWMAGAGVRGGHVHGATDELGYFAVQDRVSMYDLHATMLHILGLDHKRLTYYYNGRDFRLTDVHGKVIEQILT